MIRLTARQRSNFHKLYPNAMEHYERIEQEGSQPAYPKDMPTMSNTCCCYECDQPIFAHPRHPFVSWMVIDCEGRFWNL